MCFEYDPYGRYQQIEHMSVCEISGCPYLRVIIIMMQCNREIVDWFYLDGSNNITRNQRSDDGVTS